MIPSRLCGTHARRGTAPTRSSPSWPTGCASSWASRRRRGHRDDAYRDGRHARARGVPNALLDVIEDQGYAVLEALSVPEVGAVRDALAPYLGEARSVATTSRASRPSSTAFRPSRAFDRLIEDDRVLDVAARCSARLSAHGGAGDQPRTRGERAGPPLRRGVLLRAAHARAPCRSARCGRSTTSRPRTAARSSRPAARTGVTAGPTRPSSWSRSRCPRARSPSTRARWHAGEANTTDRFRLGVSIQYVVAWARQQESYLLAVPPEMAKDVSPRLRQLLGYSIHPPFMGHVDGRHPEKP